MHGREREEKRRQKIRRRWTMVLGYWLSGVWSGAWCMAGKTGEVGVQVLPSFDGDAKDSSESQDSRPTR